jgi:meso-butanediol dehydrogenase/(S,S)-butanediol dehydrogenase/diacetyl reductase
MTYNTESLEGKVAVITGASSGIGAALALALADAGVKLALCSRRGRNVEVPGALSRAVDVADRQAVNGFVDEAVEHFGRFDIAVANAGVGSYGPFMSTSEEHIDEMIATNVLGTINLYRAVVPHLRANGSGELVTVSSEAGRRGFAGEAVYCASKFAQVGLTRALDNELRDDGIRCTNVCPGGVHTEFAIGDNRGRTHDSETVQAMMAPEDVAQLILFIVSRPRNFRILETALRPMSEASWG